MISQRRLQHPNRGCAIHKITIYRKACENHIENTWNIWQQPELILRPGALGGGCSLCCRKMLQLKIADITLASHYFSQDLEDEPPTPVREFKDELRKSDAVLFATPRSITTHFGATQECYRMGEPAGQGMGWQSRRNNERFDGAKRRGALSNAFATNFGRPGCVHHEPSEILFL